tara:strand:+ start:291 stop:1019 length:729 start_codon:yes stop_codon:yes gene_type:complete
MNDPGFYRPPPIGGEAPPPTGTQPQKKGTGRIIVYVILGGFLVVSLAVGAVIYGVSAFFEGLTEPLREKAAEVLSECPTVVEEMGEPKLLEGNWFGLPQGNVQTSNDTGTAEITYQVEAERGHGTVSLTAELNNGVWQPSKVLVHPEGGAPIDLLHCMMREQTRATCHEGQGESCLRAGVLFMTSAPGLSRDDTEAMRLFEAGCTLGHVPSCRASETGGVSALAKDSQQGLLPPTDGGPPPE